jgi:hypothetical protein
MVQNFLVLDFFEIVNHYHLPKTFGRTVLDASCKLIQVPLVQTCKIINYEQKVVRNFENQILDKHFGCFFFYDAHIVDDFHWRIAACGVEQNQPGALVHVDALERLPFSVYFFAAWKIGGAKVILNKSLPFIIQAWFWFKAKKLPTTATIAPSQLIVEHSGSSPPSSFFLPELC